MVDMAIVIIGTLVSILLAATSYAALEYYRRLRNAQKE